MRGLLLFIGWSSVIGSFGDGALGLYAFWVIISDNAVEFSLSLDNYLKHYVAFIYWVKQLAFYVMPHDFATWLFSIPALAYFPVRIFISVVIGLWALRKAAEMKSNS